MPDEQPKNRQHYVPELYLKNFIDPESPENRSRYLWVFPKYKNIAYKKSPKGIAYEIDLHTLTGEPDPYHFENRLMDLEGKVAPVIREVLDGNIDFSGHDRRYLMAKFISFMNYRTKRAKEHFRIMMQNIMKGKVVEEINNAGGLTEFAKQRGYEDEMGETEFFEAFNAMKLRLPTEYFLELMVGSVIRSIPSIYDRNWAFITPESADRVFITSDHPVKLYNARLDDGAAIPGFAYRDTDIIFPLSPRLCLYVSYGYSEEELIAPDETVLRINMMTANDSHEFIIASTNDFDRLFVL